MKNFTRRVFTGLAAGALAIATVVAASSPTQASEGTFTPDGGPNVLFTGNNITFTIEGANQTLICDQFDMELSVESPGESRYFRDRVGLAYPLEDGCINPASGEVSAGPYGLWGVWVDGAEVGSVSPVTLYLVTMWADIEGCQFNIMGHVWGDFDDAIGHLTPTGSSLVVQDEPSGATCAKLGLARWQTISVNGTWTTSGLSITNP